MNKYRKLININIWGYIWMINSDMVDKLGFSKLHNLVFVGCPTGLKNISTSKQPNISIIRV